MVKSAPGLFVVSFQSIKKKKKKSLEEGGGSRLITSK